MTAPFPTRKQEEWRYADLESLKPVWDLLAEPERIDLEAGESRELVWIPGDQPVQVRRVHVSLRKRSELRLFLVNSAVQYGRVELSVDASEGARFDLFAANIGSGQSTNEIVTTMRHLEPGGTSRQIVRSVLGDTSVGTYMGRIEVARGAQKTDAEQSVKAILTDRGATANAKPELEIFADDVKCAHGATVGELDQTQLFYLQSRGLPPADARALLLEGFVMGLWDSISDPADRERMVAAAGSALRRLV